MPMRRISSAVHSAQRLTSAACSGSALMLGIARYALSSSTYLSRLVLMKSMTLFMAGFILPHSRHDSETTPPVQAVDLEVPAVEREDAFQPVALGDAHERRVGEIHR